MMSDGSVITAINPFSRRKKKYKQKNSSGIPPQVGDAAAPNPGSEKIFTRQKSSAAAASPSSAHGSVSTALNPCARRKNKFKQRNSSSSPGIPPQVEDWDNEILDSAHGVKDGIAVVSTDLELNGPLTGGYIPAVHHAQPVRWVRKCIPIVPEQFADADDSPGTPPQVDDWDRGIAAAATKLGSVPLDGVKDGLGGPLQDLTLNGPLTGGYTPAVHHARPVRWVRRRVHIEAGQFADADE